MAKVQANPIGKLEKDLNKLQQQLLKAHKDKITKLSKSIASCSNKAQKAKVKLSSLTPKKTPAAIKQKEKTQSHIAELNLELRTLKEELSFAKTANKNTNFLHNIALKTAKELAKPKKKVQKQKITKKKDTEKKAIKKQATEEKTAKTKTTKKETIKKKTAKQTTTKTTTAKMAKKNTLTPDLSTPIGNKSHIEKSKNNWAPVTALPLKPAKEKTTLANEDVTTNKQITNTHQEKAEIESLQKPLIDTPEGDIRPIESKLETSMTHTIKEKEEEATTTSKQNTPDADFTTQTSFSLEKPEDPLLKQTNCHTPGIIKPQDSSE